MGGDDLGDDDYLSTQIVADDDSDDNDNDNAFHNDDDDGAKKKTKKDKKNNKKRNNNFDGDTDNDEIITTKKSKKQKTGSTGNNNDTGVTSSSTNITKAVIEAGRKIERQSVEKQAKFLSTVLKHYHLLSSSSNDDNDNDSTLLQFQAQHFVPNNNNNNNSAADDDIMMSLEMKIKSVVSNKKLKNWKFKQSPMIVIVCLSARRAVSILKDDLSNFKVRVAKLFPKNSSIQDQQSMLQQTTFPIAIGTPHRLLQLCNTKALNFNKTALVVLDGHLNSKAYTVCTLPDTAPHCMELLRDYVLPQYQKQPKQDIKIAFS